MAEGKVTNVSLHADGLTSDSLLDAAVARLRSADETVRSSLPYATAPTLNASAGGTISELILNLVPKPVFAKDREGRYVAANDALAREFGMTSRAEILGKTDFDLLPAHVAEANFHIEKAIMAGGVPVSDPADMQFAQSGGTRWGRLTRTPFLDETGEVCGLIGHVHDVTALREAEQALNSERALFRAMIDQVPDYLFVKDTKSRFVVANNAVAHDLGREPAELIGKTDFDLHKPEHAAKFYADEQKVIATGLPFIDNEEMIVDADGRDKWFASSKVALRDSENRIVGIVGVSRDITDRKIAEQRVHHMALHDGLTGLPNRTLLMDRLEQNILQSRRIGGRLAALFIDIDEFKAVNDSLGHNAGDILLKVVADRMVASVRESDTVARLGGDEFIILLVDPEGHAEDPIAIADRIRRAIAEPILIADKPFRVSCSIGVASYPSEGADANALLKNADIAMYEAKKAGRNEIRLYSFGMATAARERWTLQENLRSAIANGELTLVYQPLVDLKTGRIFATEALARWNHPTLGDISPARFIPLAEESGLIVALGDWALFEACRQNRAWQDAGGRPISVCVNVSALQLKEPDWVDRVIDTLSRTGLDPAHLELELTESMLMDNVEEAIAAMRRLQALGVNFAIDDFGTGYSSLSALKDLPVARLKIDRSFIRNLPNDPGERDIAAAIISLGHKLNMNVIAEGVENEAQLAFLRENNCDEAQGYLFGKPSDAATIAAALATGPNSPLNPSGT